jgi:hypothetical protein
VNFTASAAFFTGEARLFTGELHRIPALPGDHQQSRFFNMSDGFWVGLQVDYDAAMTKQALAKTLAKIKPWVVPAGPSENDVESRSAAQGSRREKTRLP